MDYSFYVHKIGQLDEHIRLSVLDKVKRCSTSATSKNFRKHAGYEVTESGSIDAEIFKPLAYYLPALFEHQKLVDVEVGVLKANGVLGEHTDNNPPTNRGWITQRIHKVHFVLQSEGGWCTHRRSHKEEVETTPLHQGGIYVFNNYVWHSVGNPSAATERIHLVAQYRDDNWDLKIALYKHLQLTGFQPY